MNKFAILASLLASTNAFINVNKILNDVREKEEQAAEEPEATEDEPAEEPTDPEPEAPSTFNDEDEEDSDSDDELFEMIDSAIVAAEFAEDTKADDATTSDNGDTSSDNGEAKKSEPMKLEVDGDGNIMVK